MTIIWYIELASLLNIVGIDVADIIAKNDNGASFRDIQRYIMASHSTNRRTDCLGNTNSLFSFFLFSQNS